MHRDNIDEDIDPFTIHDFDNLILYGYLCPGSRGISHNMRFAS